MSEDTRENERMYVVIEPDMDSANPFAEKVYGYYLDPQIAKNEVEWLKQIGGIKARIVVLRIDTRRL